MNEVETTQTIPQVTPVLDTDKELVAKVDELGVLGEKLPAAKKIVAAYDKLRKEVVARAEQTISPEDVATLIGHTHITKLTAKQMKRDVINKQAIFEALGNDMFVELAQFSLADLDKYLTPAQLEKAVAEIAAGPRRVSTAKRDA